MSGAIYQIRNLMKVYNNRLVLDIPKLDIHPGELFALVGPSGAGKSTLLRLLNFLEPPTSGSIAFQGWEFTTVGKMPLELRRQVTMVFQRPILLDSSVQENVIYGLRLRRHRDSHSLAQTALEMVGLRQFAGQRARTLSGGEAQRVALARAMALQPAVLLLDEPTANLDPYNVCLIENIITALNQQYGITMVLVTHNVFQARRLAQRVALLLEGKLIEDASVDEFFAAPKDECTAAFVRGEMVY